MFTNHPEHDTDQSGQSTFTVPFVAAITSAACVVALVMDMTSPIGYMPPPLRGLAMVLALGALVLASVRWADDRAERRHQDELAEIRAQSRGTEYIRGYVDGLERRGFNP